MVEEKGQNQTTAVRGYNGTCRDKKSGRETMAVSILEKAGARARRGALRQPGPYGQRQQQEASNKQNGTICCFFAEFQTKKL